MAKNDRALFIKRAPGVMAALMRDFPGLDVASAAAILGNLGGESRLAAVNEERPTIAGSRGGYGWAQWTASRRRDAEAFWAKRKMDPATDAAQYAFLFYELKYVRPWSLAIPAVMRAGTLEQKVYAFERAYEKAGKPNYANRNTWARLALQAFNEAPQEAPVHPDDPKPEPVTPQWGEDTLAVFEVRAIQQRLRDVGLGRLLGTTGPKRDGVDGAWGPLTASAIFAFQYRAGLEPDGHWNDATKAALAAGFDQPDQPAPKETTMLAGKKTYLVAAGSLVFAVAGVATGHLDLNAALQIAVQALAAMGLRDAIAKAAS